MLIDENKNMTMLDKKCIINKSSIINLNKLINNSNEQIDNYNPNSLVVINNSKLNNLVYEFETIDDYISKKSGRMSYMDENEHLIVKFGKKEYKYGSKTGFIIFNTELNKLILTKKVIEGIRDLSHKSGFIRTSKYPDESVESSANRCFKNYMNCKIDINLNIPQIKINNTIYFIISIDENNFVDNDRVEFINLSNLKDLNINKETKIVIHETLLLCKKVVMQKDLII